jgi:hypothetical protein
MNWYMRHKKFSKELKDKIGNYLQYLHKGNIF